MEALRTARVGAAHRSGKLTLKTAAKSPAGAGLGGSSTLSISMLGALSAWEHGALTHNASFDHLPSAVDRETLVETARDVETTVIQVPAGMQDYYGAAFGGLQSLQWGVGRPKRATLNESPGALAEIASRTLLFYSGQSRNSGINNWSLFQGFINRDPDVRRRFEAIVQATHQLWDAWSAGRWSDGAHAIREEWLARRGLAAGITTPEIDEAFRIGERHGITSGKICGAGGGGCFFLFAPEADPERLARARAEISQIPGLGALPFQCAPHGLEVSGHRA
jgi:D-glycero-alpha-D-manno-heptose-7-phosphate kinase